MFGFSKEELASFYHQVVTNVAQRIGITNFEWKSIGELDIEISKLNNEIHGLLCKFFKDYQAWYDYSYENGIGKIFDFNNGSGAQYIELSSIRDTTRNELLEQLNSIKKT